MTRKGNVRQISDSTYQVVCPACGGTTNFRDTSIGGTTKCRNCCVKIFLNLTNGSNAASPGFSCLGIFLGLAATLSVFAILGVAGLAWLGSQIDGDDQSKRATPKTSSTEGRAKPLSNKLAQDESGNLPPQSIETQSDSEDTGDLPGLDLADEPVETVSKLELERRTLRAARTWRSSSGKFEVEASYVSYPVSYTHLTLPTKA